jgi:fructose transport system substrate-binding protein
MRSLFLHRALGVATGMVLAACGTPADSRPVIGLVTKTDNNPFFVKMREGAEQAAAGGGARLVAAAGRNDGDNAGQVTAIENLVAARAQAILISPSDAKAIVPAVRKARDAGVLVIAVDSPTDPVEAADALFATDNYRAGELIGRYVRQRLGATPARIATLDLLPGHPVGAQRHNGFLKGYGLPTNPRESNELAEPPGVVCMADALGDQARGQTAMETCLQKHPELNVVYTINEPTAAGARTALERAGRAKDVILVSVDGGCRGVQAIVDGRLDATAQQYPLAMAELGVRAALTAIGGGTRPTGYVDTGVALITARTDSALASVGAAEALTRCWGER